MQIQDNVVRIVTRQLDRRLRNCGSLFFTNTSRPSLGPIKPPIQWVPGALTLEEGGGEAAAA